MGSETTDIPVNPPPARRLSLRSKLLLGFGGLLAILLVVSGTSLFFLSRYSHTLEQIFRENYDTITYCEAMKQALDRLDYDAQRMLWDNTPISAQELSRWNDQFATNASKQKNNTSLPGEAEMTAAVVRQWDAYRRQYDTFRSAEALAERRTAYDTSLAAQAAQLRRLLGDLSEMNLHNMAAVDGRVRDTINTVQHVLWLLAAIGVGLAVLFVATIGPRILRPLSALTRSVRQIADGQLDQRVNVQGDDELGQLAGAFNVMTERLREARRLDHDRLARTEQTTQMAIDSLPDAVAVLSASGQVELANRTAQERFSLVPGDPLSRIPPALQLLHEQVMQTGRPVEPQNYRSALQRFDSGQERFFLPRASPLMSADGRVVGVTVILSDVTRLKETDEAKSDLVSTVSHELKTPLTNIRMATHMLAEEETFGPLTEQQATLLTTARKNTERLYQTVENLLGIGRIESGRAPLRLEPIPVARVIEQAIEPMLPVFEHRGVHLEVLPPPSLDVLVDPLCVGHILANLLSNAARHAPAESRVTVACEAEQEFVWFRVTDSGPGISPENLKRLFEKFFRVTRAGETTGAGLGLAIARDIVTAHGGRIEVQSELGKGATFRFSLQHAAAANVMESARSNGRPAA